MNARNDDQHAAIAFLVSTIRPTWDRPGIESVLRRIDPAIGLGQVAHAAIVAAVTRGDQSTPAIIAMDGPHWSGCLGNKPPVRLPTWRDPHADVTPADPAAIRRIRARKDRP